MAFYKLKNITNTLGKRDNNLNTIQTIKFKDIVGVKGITIHPGLEIIIEATYLPVSAQKLRADGVITVVEIDRNTYQKLLNAQDTRIAEQNIASLVKEQTEPTKLRETEDKYKKTREKIR